MTNEFYIGDTVNRNSIIDFLNKSKEKGNDIYRVKILNKGEAVVRFALPPFLCEDVQHVYSLSKTFTATAIGMLVDDGKLSVDDYMTDLFPDEAPEVISPNLKALQLKHLLSMNTGHEECVMWKIKEEEDIVKAFFKEEIEHAPGTHFAYNNSATYMLSATVRKVTGKCLFDFLWERLFEPMGMTEVYWTKYHDGNNNGAVGLHISLDSMAKLGLMYQNGGIYEGKRYLSEEWIKMATSIQSDNSGNGNPDWCAGYGYQIWMNAQGGYRGDGAFGQLIFVKDDFVVAVNAFTADMQGEITDAVTMLEDLFATSKGTDNDLKGVIDNFYVPEKSEVIGDKFLNKIFKVDKNKQEISEVKFTKNADNSVTVGVNTDNGWQDIECGYGEYKKSELYIKELKPLILTISNPYEVEKLSMASCYTIKKDTFTIHTKYLSAPHDDEIAFKIDGDNATMILKEFEGLRAD